MKKILFMFAVVCMLAATAVGLCSCGGDDSKSSDDSKKTVVIAVMTQNLYDIYDYSFAIDGTAIAMEKKSVENGIVTLGYEATKSYSNAKVTCTMTLKSGYDTEALDDSFAYGTGFACACGSASTVGLSKLASAITVKTGSFTFSKTMDNLGVSTKKEVLENYASRFATFLTGTIQ